MKKAKLNELLDQLSTDKLNLVTQSNNVVAGITHSNTDNWTISFCGFSFSNIWEDNDDNEGTDQYE